MKGKEHQSGFQFVSEILRSNWMIDEQFAQSMFPFIQSLLNAEPNALAQATSDYNKAIGVEDGIAYVSIKDVIMSADNCGSLGAESLSTIIKGYNDDKKVEGMILILNTPGGSVTAGAKITDALKAFDKPIVSLVEGYAASAGYWIAANTDRIMMSNAFSELGSIGVYVTLFNTKKAEERYGYEVMNIYAPQSSEKNQEVEQALKGNKKPMEDKLAKLADLFIADIKGNREQIKDDAFKGKMYLASEALEKGLADEMGNMETAKAWIKKENKNLYI